MIRIPVVTQVPYEAQIERGLLARAGATIRAALPSAVKLTLVYDRELRDLYRDELLHSLRRAGFEVFAHSLRGGKDAKSADTLRALLGSLADHGLGRNDALVALGGGALLDVTGFAAALYLRGIRYVSIPSTLSAMADKCVGGRTGIHTRAGFDLVGAYHQPALALVDPDLLGTLDEAHMRSGAMACLRLGVVGGEPLFSLVAPGFDASDVIARCLDVKARLAAQDERDTGEARALSLGRSLARALGVLMGSQLAHGEAAGLALSFLAHAACSAGRCDKEVSQRVQAAVADLLPCARPECTPKQLAAALLSVEKPSGGSVSLAIPEQIGRVRMLELAAADLEAFLKPALRKRAGTASPKK